MASFKILDCRFTILDWDHKIVSAKNKTRQFSTLYNTFHAKDAKFAEVSFRDFDLCENFVSW